ncbi:TetR family transcriptional regulator [Streptomyces samsunensis]|uniref:TetR family transcriptional regulator n=2 Tax=Streptomyces TaxID=1883 RepID=A0ABX6W501_STRMQ|nr:MULTISPECIES: TetR family transcriptional regulator [Streptomyces]AQA11625.1 TetR family transcriptional regulator [Streptomyces autolyticus]MCD9589032.1 TetR family transcriptional regulator [Streptomyces sp. 8ZJF_21]MCM3808814.1 TetR family transcriptional regulator [Streptomyces sp. DR7-3]MCQ6249223.1 TetR family transcriptional regulator [Streptomyces malaysiensis]NUH38266.1 TetR family transcriptional regulator [Streptomyces samsunensis]
MTTDEAVADTGTPPPAGLRERKKRRTRSALVRAALELFTRQGYERTTVDEIAEAVEVSQRTFFRYFTSKEDVAFASQEAAECHFFAALCGRPADEAPLAALRGAALDAWGSIGDSIEQMVTPELHIRMYRVIESTPSLLAVHLRRIAEMEERLAREIARREGLDIDADPRPRLVVAMFGGVIRVAGKLWGERGEEDEEEGGEGDSVVTLRDLTAFHLDYVGPSLAEQWDK